MVSTGVVSIVLGQDSSDEEAFIGMSWELYPEGKMKIPEGGSNHIDQYLSMGPLPLLCRDTCGSYTPW